MICGNVLIIFFMILLFISMKIGWGKGIIISIIGVFLGVFLRYDLPRLINRPDLLEPVITITKH